MTEEANVISIDGTEYKESDLSDKQRKYIWHIRDLQDKVNRRRLDLEPLELALQSYTNMLITEVKEQYKFENGENFDNATEKRQWTDKNLIEENSDAATN